MLTPRRRRADVAAPGPQPAPLDVLDSPAAGGLVVRGALIRVVGFAGGVLLSLVGVVLLTRHLGVVDYGKYVTVVSLITVVAQVTDIGMATYAVREYVQRSGADRERLMRTILGLRIALSAVGVLAAMAIAVAAGYDGRLVLGTALMGIGLVLTVAQTTLQLPIGASLRLGTLTALDVARQGLTALLISLLVVAGAGLVPFLAVTIPVQMILIVWTALLVRGQMPLRPRFDASEWLSLARGTVAFALALAVGTIYQYTAQILTSFVATAEQTGYFSASFRVFIIVAAVPGLLVSSAFPLLSRAAQDDRGRLASALQGLFDGTVILGGAAAIGVVLGAQPIIDVVAGPHFAPAVPVLRIQGVALLATFVMAVWGFGLLALHRHRQMIVANLLSFTTTAVVVLALAAIHGARGAALGTLLGELVLLTGYFVGITRGHPELRPRLTSAVRALLAMVLAGGIALLARLGPVAEVAIALTAYALLLIAFRAIPADVLALLPEGLRRRLGAIMRPR